MSKIKPYLSLPIATPIATQDYQITEGWLYSEEESAIHGVKKHRGVDYTVPRGTPVLAAASGWTMASYTRTHLIDPQTQKPRIYKGKPVGYSYGNFVQIYHPQVDRYTQYGHLDSINPKIPFTKPRLLKDGRLWPYGHKIDPQKYPEYKRAVWIERGEVIGYVGDTGLSWGYQDYPTRPDPDKFPSWDEPHLHFEEFSRDKQKRKIQKDPYDLYQQASEYPYPGNNKSFGPNHLWLVIPNET